LNFLSVVESDEGTARGRCDFVVGAEEQPAGFRCRVHLNQREQMIIRTSHALGKSIAAFAAATLFAACADGAPTLAGPETRAADPTPVAFPKAAETEAATFGRLPDLGICTQLGVPEGSELAFHVFSTGVQIYSWTGTAWRFVSPMADLFADATRNGLVGTHFGGPTWQTLSGSRVVGTVTHVCVPDASAIAWLRLDAVSTGSGVFNKTAFIQRVNTVGGLAPSAPGSTVDEEARVPYTADYFFYRAP
jgi:hypothetical protein